MCPVKCMSVLSGDKGLDKIRGNNGMISLSTKISNSTNFKNADLALFITTFARKLKIHLSFNIIV